MVNLTMMAAILHAFTGNALETPKMNNFATTCIKSIDKDNTSIVYSMERKQVEENFHFTLRLVSYQDYELEFMDPYVFQVKKEKKTFVCEDENFDIHIIASSEEDLYNQLSEEFVFLWKEYALEDDINLTSDAIKLKNRLLKVFKKNGL